MTKLDQSVTMNKVTNLQIRTVLSKRKGNRDKLITLGRPRERGLNVKSLIQCASQHDEFNFLFSATRHSKDANWLQEACMFKINPWVSSIHLDAVSVSKELEV